MPHILIVEDDTNLSQALKLKLTSSGFEASLAIDGAIGLSLFKQHHFDLILLDLIMPNVDGVEFLYQIKATNNSLPPIIVLTNSEQAALPEGVNSYLIKAQTSLDKIVAEIKHTLHLPINELQD